MRWEIFTSRYDKLNQESTYQTLSESISFCKRYDKRYWCVFRFAIPTAVHLQNVNAKFHKVVYIRYSGEVENVYIFVFLYDNFTEDNMC